MTPVQILNNKNTSVRLVESTRFELIRRMFYSRKVKMATWWHQ